MMFKALLPLAFLVASGTAFAGDVTVPCTLPNVTPDVVGVQFNYGTSPGVYPTVWVGKKGPVASCTQVVTNMLPGKTYYVVAQSYDAAGNYSAKSNEYKIVVPALLPVPILGN